MRHPTAIPVAGRDLPVLGHTAALLRDPLAFLRSLPAYGGVVKVRLGPYSAIVVTDPDLTRQVLVDDQTFDKGGFFWDMGREVAGNGLTTCPHAEHRRQRRLVQPAFHRSRLAAYAEIMADETAAATGRWRDGQVLDLGAETSQITARVTLRAIFRAELSPNELKPMLDDISAIITGAYQRILMPPALRRAPLPNNIRYGRARERFFSTVRAVIAGRSANQGDQGDLLSKLLTPPEDETAALSDDEIVDQVSQFFVAGIETAAATLAWSMHLLTQHPEIQRKLHAEIAATIHDRLPTLSDVTNLQLAGQVVTETLRLYPPTWILTRVATAATSLGGHDIPAGAHIVFSPYVIHHRPDLYPDPERFNPDRWSDQDTSRPRHHFVPFGYGPRRCIGSEFGFTEAVIALAVIAARWRLQPIAGEKVRVVRGAALHPHGLHLRIISRDTATTAL